VHQSDDKPGRRPVSRRLLASLAGTSALALMGGLSLASPAMAAAAPLAPAQDGAASGGAVIVVLKAQHPELNMRTQSAALKSATEADQAPVVAAIKAAGGTNLVQVPEPSEVAATIPAAAVASLQANPAVARIISDPQVQVVPSNPLSQPPVAAQPAARASSGTNCPSNPNPGKPLQEGEALTNIHASNGIPGAPDEGNTVATGKGVIIANDGANNLAGNPNFIRADGTPVVLNAPDPTADHSNDEDYGDASSMVAQGTVVYQYSKALPASTLPIPANCTFVIRGDAPDASLVDLTGIDTPILSTAQVAAGIDATVMTTHADVISESFGGGTAIRQANDAAVAAGVTVVVSSGDSGPQGTFDIQSDDPAVIGAAGTDSFRLIAMDDGYTKFVSNQMSALSSGGPAPTNKLVDLAAPSWYGSEAACADGIGGCPPNYPVESMRGTSESAPLISGAAADVIQAYRDTHNGASPTPAQVKDILTSTATDINAPADLEGAGLLNVYAAVRAAQVMPGSTLHRGNSSSALVASPSQLDLQGNGGSVTSQNVSLYNTSSHPVTVKGSYRQIGQEFQIGRTVTEAVSAPDPSLPVPHEGATAASTIHFTVPKNLGQLDLDMIWPDPTNSNRLYYQVFNPQGALVQESYDDGTLPTATRAGTIPNHQHVGVSSPQAGRWTAKILWGGVDQDLALAQPAPGTFTGNLSFKVSGQNWVTSPASKPVTIKAHSTATVPLNVTFPAAPGDHPESVQFTSGNTTLTSFPVERRTLIPSNGGAFQDLITASVGRGMGQLNTFKINVPAGLSQLMVTFHAPDASTDNVITYTLTAPDGTVVQRASTPNTTGPDPGTQTLTATTPAAGLYEIDVQMGAAMSGNEFTQLVQGNVTETGSG
jgi:subtilase family protein